jgi:hypothetical protein
MQDIQHTPGTRNGKDIFKQIECFNGITQSGWGGISKSADAIAVINKANSSLNIVDYLNTKFKLEHVSSSAGWNYRTSCPFHKGGHERTPSFFINATNNRYYCQACGVTGGIVQFISKKFARPEIIVAEHILKCVDGKVNVDADRVNKINEYKKFQKALLDLSDMHREFLLEYQYDNDALEYITKIMKGFDNIVEANPDGVGKSMANIIDQFKIYLEKYRNANTNNT